MSDFFDDVGDLYKGGRKLLDVAGIGEAISIAKTGKGFTAGADKVLGPLGIATSLLDLGTGGYNAAKAIDTGDGVAGADAVHDILGGSAGMLGNVPGPVGAVAKSFSAGYAVGDMLAPVVFGSEEEDNKPHMEQVPEDGVFKPSTGNQYVDGALDLFGIRD